MALLQLVPAVLGLLLLAAHFLRGGCFPAVLGLVGLCALLALRRPWVARVTQVVLVLGALEWLRTLVALASRRAASGEPATRLVLILGAVVVVTLAAALLFQSRTLAERYRLGGG